LAERKGELASRRGHEPQGKYTVYFLTNDWTGLHDMFEQESLEAMAGVPLVPMLWKELADRGHDVHVFVLGEFSSEKHFDMGGFHVHRLFLPEFILGRVIAGRPIRTYLKFGWLWTQIGLYRAVMRQAAVSKPDVIYSYRSTPAVVGHVLSRRFHSVHIGRRWGTWLGHILFNEPWYKRLRAIGEMLSYKIPYFLITSNDGTLGDKVARKLGFPEENHRFWLDGTKRGIYRPDLDVGAVKRSVGIGANDKMIFAVARLDFWKRFDRAIDAMPVILKRVPSARLVIAGGGPLQGDLENQIQRLDLQGKVILLGSTPHDRVADLHNAADIFLTLQDLTNLGNQILEAMHSGTCVVAYDVGGTRDVAKDGINCVLLSDDDLPKLGEIVASLLEDDPRRQKLAQGALDYARQHIWFWDERIGAEIGEIDRLVGENRRRWLTNSATGAADGDARGGGSPSRARRLLQVE